MAWSRLSPARKGLAVAALLALLAVLGGGAFYAWSHRPLPKPRSVPEGLAALDTTHFKEQLDNRQLDYLRQVSDLFKSLPVEEQQRINEAARTDDVLARRLRYLRTRVQAAETLEKAVSFARAKPEERTRLLDEQIDKMQVLAAAAAAARANKPTPAPGDATIAPATQPMRRPSFEDMRARILAHFQNQIQTGNPQEMSLVNEFWKAVAKRREERGLH